MENLSATDDVRVVPHLDRVEGAAGSHAFLRAYSRASPPEDGHSNCLDLLAGRPRMSSHHDRWPEDFNEAVHQDQAFLCRREKVDLLQKLSVFGQIAPAAAEDPDSWSEQEVEDYFSAGGNPAYRLIALTEFLCLTGLALATEMDNLFEQQATILKYIRQDCVPHSGEMYTCVQMLDVLQSEIDSRISVIPDEPVTFTGRLQEWMALKHADDLDWFQQNRAKLSVVDRFKTMNKEIPRWNSLSPATRLTLFRVAVGIPWLEANSKNFNDFQHITKGG